MAAEELPSEFDLVIVGTGLCESVVAAACSRVGQKVLHLDRRSFYAGDWASFTFNSLLTWIQQQQEGSGPEEPQDWSSLLEDGEELIPLNQSYSSISDVEVHCYVSEEVAPSSTDPDTGDEGELTDTNSQSEPSKDDHSQSEPSKDDHSQSEPGTDTGGSGADQDQDQDQDSSDLTEEEEPTATQSQSGQRKLTLSDLLNDGRRFNIDLVSKLLFSRGSLVNLLIQSNVSRYAEFKNVSRILTVLHDNAVTQVPCSRADVFSSRQLSVVDKRKLMKFLTSCLDENNPYTEFFSLPYMDFLEGQSLGEELRHFLFHSIAMATKDTSTEEGLASTRHFLRCLGRYGNTPFLFPVYGLGEIPQCFCRMCAVFGGIYCLRHTARSLVLNSATNRVVAVVDSRGQRISCSHCLLEPGLWGQTQSRTRSVSRAVLITDRSLLPSESEQQVVSLVTVPPSVRIIELSPSTMTCTSGTYLVHLTCPSSGPAHSDLFPVVTRLFSTPESADNGPNVLWSFYFNIDNLEVKGQERPVNLHLSSAPDSALGHDSTVAEAKEIFHQIVPDEEFCPPAPNPEDIIYEPDNTEGNPAENPDTSTENPAENPDTSTENPAENPDTSTENPAENPTENPEEDTMDDRER